MFRSDPAATFERVQRLTAYMEQQVLAPACHDGGAFICPSEIECRASATGLDFHAGQLSHVGEHYDLSGDGQSMRVVMVGQEYGSGMERVGLATRRSIATGGRSPTGCWLLPLAPVVWVALVEP